MGTLSNNNPYCGRMVTITYGTQSIVAKVVDKCMGCDGDAIDLSYFAWDSLGINRDLGRVTGNWYFNN
jgi:hypothetical protein